MKSTDTGIKISSVKMPPDITLSDGRDLVALVDGLLQRVAGLERWIEDQPLDRPTQSG